MFCLRSWIPILFFLTNASPIYLVLFVSATYFLNRPCVYCSLLLAILVISLFDFGGNWFEPRFPHGDDGGGRQPGAAAAGNGSSSSTAIADALALAGAALNATAAAVVDSVVGQQRVSSGVGGGSGAAAVNSTLVEWLKGALRKEWRIECLDIVVRL